MKDVRRGMKVRIGRHTNDSPTAVWIVLDRHPDKGHWWLHRWDAGQWQSTSARYTELTQVIR